MKHVFIIAAMLLQAQLVSFAGSHNLSSPDGHIRVTVDTGVEIKWSATYDGEEIIASSKAALILADGITPGIDDRVRRIVRGSVSEVINPVVAHKRSEIQNNCNTLTIIFRSGFSLQFRAYNDGVAYRFESSLKDPVTVKNEVADIRFPEGSEAWYPLEDGYMSHNERKYIFSSLDTIGPDHLASLPTLFQTGCHKVLITESDIRDYPGMWLRGKGSGEITGVWPEYPDEEKLKSDRDLLVTSRKDFIAQTEGTRTFPWRIFIVAPQDGDLIESDMVFKLAAPQIIKDAEWIKPGKVAWDWWNANNIFGVGFRAGINNDTYKYYIDFASENGIEYILLDEGWYRIGGSVLESVPEIDVPAL